MDMSAIEMPETWHHPRRPGWDCVVCREPWPCPPAKVDLAEEYANDRVSLLVYLSMQLYDAIDDSAANKGQPEPADLFDRFLGWARPRKG